MTNKLQIARARLLLLLIGLAFVGLSGWLVYLQVVCHDELAKMAQDNTQRRYWESARRGDILDVHGNILATSVVVKRICANPSLIGNQQATVARALAPLLQMDEGELADKLTPHIVRTATGGLATNNLRYVCLTKTPKSFVSEETWQRIFVTMTNLTFGLDEKHLSRANKEFLRNLRREAVFAESVQIRNYPNDSLAAQVIGFSAIEETKADGRITSQIVGRDGIEYSMNRPLSGVAGWRLTETDSKKQELVALRNEDVHPRDGLNVVLTIDEAVQHILESVLAEALPKHTPKSITGIVMRPRTGEILALASLPNYNPNNLNTVSTNSRNRLINDIMEPGSTFKIVVVSGAINDGLVKLTDEFDCEHGHFAFAGRTLHDHESYGTLSVKEIIMKSSNIGAAKIGIRLGEQGLYDYAWDYGFGQRSGIQLPGEQGGILHPTKNWSKVSIAQIPMGQGVAVTGLQMAMAMAAIANDGWLMRPMLVSQLQERDGGVVQRYTSQRVRQVISEAASKRMIEALKAVVTKQGTAAEAALKNYAVAGKTGTANKAEKGGYSATKYVSSFIGFFPADKPELLILVVMDEPKEGHFGGKVCGPVFREIAERCASYLNIPPDPTLMTNAQSLVAESGSKKF